MDNKDKKDNTVVISKDSVLRSIDLCTELLGVWDNNHCALNRRKRYQRVVTIRNILRSLLTGVDKVKVR